jgi:AcrR family transcriptional regulator
METVSAIFAATARILEREGFAAANTNRIAAVAGISIGTLYQYFPHKTAILIAMARRELERDRAALQAALAGIEDSRLETLARACVRALIQVHGANHRVRRYIMQVHHAEGFGQEHVTPVQEIARWLGEIRRSSTPGAMSDLGTLRLFVATRAVVGVIRAATLEDPALLEAPGFEAEVTALALRYLAEPSKSP